MPLPIRRLCVVALLTCLIVTLVAACSGVGQPAAAGQEVSTVTPTATLDPSGYQAVAPRSCMTGEWNTLQSERRQSGIVTWLQGNLIAWQPGTSNLAYLSPGERSSWFTGVLMLGKGPHFTERIPLAPTVLVTGDLTWSPSGERLAFLAFRPNEGVYTVMVVNSDGSGLTDLFFSDQARTDGRSSQKAIIGWNDDQTLQVVASCGEKCRLAYEIDVTRVDINDLTGNPLAPTEVGNYRLLNQSLEINRREVTITPAAYPKILSTPQVSRPHWSSDSRQVTYLDRRGILWVLSTVDKINYPLEIGLRDVYETQWSTNSDRIAIRAEDRVFVFEIPCQK